MRLRFSLSIVAVLLVIALLFFMKGKQSDALEFGLLVENKKQEVLFSHPLEKDDQFSIEYIHSVEKTAVRETYIVNDEGELLQVETSYSGWGVGLADPFYHRDHYYDHNDKMLHIHLDRTLSAIRQYTSALSKHTLIINNQKILLHELGECNGDVALFIIRVDAIN